MKELEAYKQKLTRAMEIGKEELQKAFKRAIEKAIEKRDDAAFGEIARISWPLVIASDHDLKALLVLYENKEAMSPVEMCIHFNNNRKKYLEKYKWLAQKPSGMLPLHPKAFLGRTKENAVDILPEEIGEIAYGARAREAIPYRLKRTDIIYRRLPEDKSLIEYNTSRIETFLFHTYFSFDEKAANKRAKEMDALMRQETGKRLKEIGRAIEQAKMDAMGQPFRRAIIGNAEENSALCVFGSVAHESARIDSDIDLLVVYDSRKKAKHAGWKSGPEGIWDYMRLILKKLKTPAHVAYIDAASEPDIMAAETIMHAKAIAWNKKMLDELKEKTRKSKAYKQLLEMEKHAKMLEKETAEGIAVPEIDVKWKELAEALRRRKMLKEFQIK